MVAGPTVSAQRMSRDGDHARYRWCADGRCAVTVVCRPRSALRAWLATRWFLWKHSDGRRREPDIQRPVHQRRGDAVVVTLDLDMRIDIHAGRPPLGIDVGLNREGLQGWAITVSNWACRQPGSFLKGWGLSDRRGGDGGISSAKLKKG